MYVCMCGFIYGVYVFFFLLASQPQKTFQSHETEVFLRLLKYGLMALDIYRVTMLPNGVLVLRNSK